jgi:fimbrial chaperone protein
MRRSTIPYLVRVSRYSVTAMWVSLLTLAASGPGEANTFSVDPTQIYLTARSTSQLLTLRNESDQPIRFQLSLFAWSQNERGQMELAPTTDIIFFPSLLTLQPRELRRVRVGVGTDFAASEKTYRLFVEELPALEASPENGVAVLMKMGIPIFLRPARMEARAEIAGLSMHESTFTFDLRNSGNVHFVPEAIRVRGRSASGEIVLDRQVEAWYVLAGGTRRFEVSLPRPDCTRVMALAVEVAVAKSRLAAELQTSPAACAP